MELYIADKYVCCTKAQLVQSFAYSLVSHTVLLTADEVLGHCGDSLGGSETVAR